MATLPYFVFSPNSIISMIGLVRGPDTTVPTPAEDWRHATVDVIIPALNEEGTIAACLESVLRQTMRPRRIVLVDDGSRDRTIEIAEAFCRAQGADLTVFRRRSPIGKTPTIKRQARELDSDVEFILDGDTILDSDTYIARTVEELYKAVGIASACGTIMPLRTRDRRRLDSQPALNRFVNQYPEARLTPDKPLLRRVANGITNMYREVLYLFLQRFIYLGQMTAFGSIVNPVGCAVAYRRKYVKDLFDRYTPVFGDDLTNSEDIFIGFALLNEGYRNIQLTDVYARTVEPEVQRLPRQMYLWSSSFLQCCYYFDDLLRSAPRGIKAAVARRRWERTRAVLPVSELQAPAMNRELALAGVGLGSMPPSSSWAVGRSLPGLPEDPLGQLDELFRNLPEVPGQRDASIGTAEDSGASGFERRRIAEPYRQAFGVDVTRKFGRPIGWVLLTSLFEKIAFPTSLLILIIFGAWEPLAVTVLGETLVATTALVIVARGQRLEYFLKGLAVAPMRYALLFYDFVTIMRFALDLWVSRNRNWRK